MQDSNVLNDLLRRSPGEKEFHQAVEEVFLTVKPVLEQEKKYRAAKILERMVEPERIILFRVTWLNDKNEVQINRGYRVQMNSAIGPYKGGLRFHPSVNLSILKFLAFEQVFKNALTGLPMGGGKGGSDFDPKGKSDEEVMKFCQAFMSELSKHIGHRTDVPAGDIGVGGREIGYLFGAYKKIQNQFTGILTGKGTDWGGSLIRPEATGYGLIYFAQNMLANVGKELKGKTCLVSGSGNVAQFAIEKIIQQGGTPVTASDSSGFIHDPEGINQEKLEYIKEIKNVKRGRINEYTEKYKSAAFIPVSSDMDANPIWDIKADCAFPCATQNELNATDASNLIRNGIILVGEGANMPSSKEATDIFIENGIMFSPGKASNAGGVATSGLEMVQNFSGYSWKAEEVDARLQEIMKNIHDRSLYISEKYGHKGNYVVGANIAGFIKVANSMMAQGIV